MTGLFLCGFARLCMRRTTPFPMEVVSLSTQATTCNRAKRLRHRAKRPRQCRSYPRLRVENFRKKRLDFHFAFVANAPVLVEIALVNFGRVVKGPVCVRK